MQIKEKEGFCLPKKLLKTIILNLLPLPAQPSSCTETPTPGKDADIQRTK
jgi:hypothetical protein